MNEPPQQQPRPVVQKHKIVSWLINQVITVANKRLNIRELQNKYNAKEGRVLQMHIVDIGKKWYFRVMDGKIEILSSPSDIAGGFETNSDTIICLTSGRRKVMHPGTRKLTYQDYTPFDAMQHGDIRIWGEAATNDALLFGQALQKYVYPEIKGELQNSVQEPAP